APQIFEGVTPPVALVPDEPLQHRERGRLPLAVEQLDGAEVWRRVAVLCDTRQIATDLQFRMNSGLQPPIDLQHQFAADERGAVALLLSDPADLHIRQVFERTQR